MDMNISQCRLCLSRSESLKNIFFQQIGDKTIASILAQHFWFEVKENDKIKDICQDCWNKLEDFHLFYTKVYNIHSELLTNVNKDIKLEIDETINPDNIEFVEDLKPNLNVDIGSKTSIANNKYSKSQHTLFSDTDDGDKWSNHSFKATMDLNDKGSKSSEIESPLPPTKRRIVKQKSCGKKRKIKTIKMKQTKKEIDPVEQAKIEEQNKQISEYFSMDCELCLLKLDSFRKLQYHYRIEHKIKGYVRCCRRKFAKRVLLVEHLERHLNPLPLICEICSKQFVAKRCLDIHMRSHVPPDERPYKCTECPKTYVIANLLKRHLETHEIERKFVCSECGKSHVTEYQLKSHQRNMHKVNNFICDVCAKPFRSKDTFERHYKSVHGLGPLPKVQCKICGSQLKDKYNLRKHMARHNDSKASFNCNICGKSAPNSVALRSHIRVVHTDKMYECNLCEKSFKRSISLKEHLASHTGDILYSCPYCAKTFNSSANMYSHRKRSHVKEWENQKLEKHKEDLTPN